VNKQQQGAKIMLNFRTNGRKRLGRLWKRPLGRPKQVCQGLTGDDDDDDDDDDENHPVKDPVNKEFYCLSQLFKDNRLFPTFLLCF
jgi:hypothetical protein